eukprot:97601-Rhodomonas_salina.3
MPTYTPNQHRVDGDTARKLASDRRAEQGSVPPWASRIPTESILASILARRGSTTLWSSEPGSTVRSVSTRHRVAGA